MRAARLAAAADALKRASAAVAPFSLALLTDRRRIANPEPVLRALPAGAAVIYRDYDDPRRESLARRYRSICRTRGVFFLVAGDRALAHAVGADGVHLPGWMIGARGSGLGIRSSGLRPLRVPSPEPRSPILTLACHGAADLSRAAAIGADLALLSPVFPTQSHPFTEPLGVDRFRALAAASPLPVLALGGVDASNARGLAGRNVAGIAAIGAFAGAP